MLRIKKNVNDLFLRRAAIIDVLDEASNINTGIEYPGNGFHSLYEAKFQTAEGSTLCNIPARLNKALHISRLSGGGSSIRPIYGKWYNRHGGGHAST